MTTAPTRKKPGRKPLADGAGKSARIEARCTAADKAALQAGAKSARVDLSTWLIQTGLAAIAKHPQTGDM